MGKNVLIVDDEKGITTAVKELLSCEGYDVFTAANGRDALAILQENVIPVIIFGYVYLVTMKNK